MIIDRRRRGRAPLAVVAPAVLAVMTGCTAGSDAGAPDTPSAPVTRDDAMRLETALTSPDPSVRDGALEPGLRGAGETPLPPGSTLQVDESRVVLGTGIADGTAEVPAHVTGPQPGDWILLLTRVGDTWTVYGTRQQP